jgi:hypothetical protein
MTAAMVVAMLQAAAAPLVGDTVWIERAVNAPAGSLIRPLPWDPGEDVALLGAPQAIARPGGWTLRYPVVLWRPGTHRLTVPGPLVIRPDGTTDSLPRQVVTIVIGSVLPAGRPDTLAPRPAVGLVPAGSRSFQPVLVLAALTFLLLAPLHWWWRRRGPPLPTAPEGDPALAVTPEQLRAWAAAGEVRAAADGWIAVLEAAPAGPARDDLLARLQDARFGAGETRRLAGLCEEASRL